MSELAIKILAIWTVSFYLGLIVFIRRLKDIDVVHFFLGCILIGAVLGQICGSTYLWYLQTYYPPIDNIQETGECLNNILDLDVKETNSNDDISEETLKKERRNKLKWLAVGYFIFYVLFQI